MLKIEIPGLPEIQVNHLVLDYNGTLAIDGTILPGIKEILNTLAENIQIHVITANTFGDVAKNLEDVNCSLVIIENENQQHRKAKFISTLGEENVIAIGNGLNDALMLKNALLGIAVIQAEGAAATTITSADIVCKSVMDALELLLNPLRLIATLRN